MSNEVVRETHDEGPTALQYLYESSARQRLTDFFLELNPHWDETSEALTKRDIIDHTGMQRKSVIEHLPILVEMGIVNVNEEHRWDRYEPAVESEQYKVLIHANNVLGEYYEKHLEDSSDDTR